MKKKLFIIIILLFLFFAYNINIFAYTITINNKTFNLDDKYLNLLYEKWWFATWNYISFTDGEYFHNFIGLRGYWGDELSLIAYDITNNGFKLKSTEPIYSEHYYYDKDTLEHINNYTYHILDESSNIIFSYDNFLCTRDIYDEKGNLFYKAYNKDFPILNWSFENRDNNIIMHTQNFHFNTVENYNLYYTTDSSNISNYKNLDKADIGSITSGTSTKYFYFLTFDRNYYLNSDTYYFISENKTTGDTTYFSVQIDFNNLIKYFDEQINDYLVQNGIYGTTFENGIPNLRMLYKRFINPDNSYYYEIYSQTFNSQEITDKYIAYYTNNTSIISDYSEWNILDIASITNTKMGNTEYYYYFHIPADTEDTTYYFVLYDKINNKYGTVTSMDLKFSNMWEYSEQLNIDVTTRFDKLISYLKDRFGFITYPFELIGDIFTRYNNIDFEEPILTIPSLSVPIYNYKLTDEINYNFNDMLEIEVVKYIHSFFLILVDVIIIYSLIQFGMKVFEEVFGNG